MNLDELVRQEISVMSSPSENVDKIIGNFSGEENVNEGNNLVDPLIGIENRNVNLDDGGNIFDPDIHAVDGEGNPKRTKRGLWAKKRGRSGTVTKPDSMASQEAGRATAETIFMFCVTCFGEEWQPIEDVKIGLNERQQMTDAWAAYFQAKGTVEMPAWVVVAIACAGYGLPRISQPKTQSRLSKMWSWFKGKIESIQRRKKDQQNAA